MKSMISIAVIVSRLYGYNTFNYCTRLSLLSIASRWRGFLNPIEPKISMKDLINKHDEVNDLDCHDYALDVWLQYFQLLHKA